MKKPGLALLSALFLAACSDPNMPAEFLDVPTPQWTEGVEIVRISKLFCTLKNARGEEFRVENPGTDIGNGLTAMREAYNSCTVEDADGVKCRWGRRETLEGCRRPNPEYQQYILNKG